MSTLVSLRTSLTPREAYCHRVSEEVRQLQRMYARSAWTRNESPMAYRQRMELAERIDALLRTVTLEEQKEYDIW